VTGRLAVAALLAMSAAAHASEATGTFDVTLRPLPGADPAIVSFAFDKHFHGDMEGTSIGQMLGFGTSQLFSAGYVAVAIERVTATLAGRHGAFALQHSGISEHGTDTATVTVIPDSGTDGLRGLTGTMKIDGSTGTHKYVFSYTLPN
jgi:hypothetical protein